MKCLGKKWFLKFSKVGRSVIGCEVDNHVAIYGSKVAEGFSAFQHRSCLIYDCLDISYLFSTNSLYPETKIWNSYTKYHIPGSVISYQLLHWGLNENTNISIKMEIWAFGKALMDKLAMSYMNIITPYKVSTLFCDVKYCIDLSVVSTAIMVIFSCGQAAQRTLLSLCVNPGKQCVSLQLMTSCCMNFAIIIQSIYFTIWKKIKKNHHHYNTILSLYNIISRHYKKSLIRSQIYHGYEELSTDTNYPIWRRQERRSKYAVQLAS